MPLLLLSGYSMPFDRSVPEPAPISSAAEDQYRELPELPTGASGRGRGGVEESAVELAAALRGVPLSAALDPCPADRLRVVWTAPGGEYRHGAVITPVGPAPDADTEHVNGAVVCEGSTYGYMGFEARWAGSAWDLVAVPFIDESDEHVHEEPAPAPLPPSAPAVATLDRAFSGGIEGYAAYEPQRTCDPTPKVGTVSLQRMLLNGNPGSRNLGISRGCSIGGQSEHKEGRAFDWGVYVTSGRERAQAEGFVTSLLATDAAGNRHALARRMGVMYVIWNRKIWSSYRAGDGWRPYSGASPHTDHVHISLSWAGALGRTSFWSGTVPADLVAMPSSATVPVAHRPGAAASGPAPSRSAAPRRARDRGAAPPSSDGREERRRERDAQRAAWEQRVADAREAWRRQREAAEEAHRAARTEERERRHERGQARAEEREQDDGGRRRRRDRDGSTPATASDTATTSTPRADRDAARRAEVARRVEEARRIEAERRAEHARRVEERRRVEAERRAEIARRVEEARRAEPERREAGRRDRESGSGSRGRRGRGAGRRQPPTTAAPTPTTEAPTTTVAPEPTTTIPPAAPEE